MSVIKIIFDHFGHPNQPFWTRWYELIKSTEFSIQSFALKNLNGQDSSIIDLKSKNTMQRARNLLFNFSFRNPVKLQIQNSTYHFGFLRSSDITHFLNAQMFPSLEPYIPSNTRLVFTFRGYDTLVRPDQDPVWKEQLNSIYKKAFRLHFVSEYLKQEAIKLGAQKSKCRVIRRSVNSEYFSPVYEKSKNIIILSIGRLTWEKGLKYGLSALAELKESGRQFEYLICGEGEEKDALLELCESLNMNDRVRFLGHQSVSELVELLGIANIFLHPSVSEGLPNVVLEAMAMELPVVSTRAGGIPEAVENEVTGILVDSKDSKILSKAIKRLIDSQELRVKMGLAGRKKILKDFTIEQEKDNWLSFYKECLN